MSPVNGTTFLQSLSDGYVAQPRQVAIKSIIDDKNSRFSKIDLSVSGVINGATWASKWVVVRVEQLASVFFCAGHLCRHVASSLMKFVDALTVLDLTGMKNAFNGGTFKVALDLFTAINALGSVVAPETVLNWNTRNPLPPTPPADEATAELPVEDEV